MVCQSCAPLSTIVGLRAASRRRAPRSQLQGADRVAHRLSKEVCYTRPLYLPSPYLLDSPTMTVPSVDQVVTTVNQVQSAVEVVSPSRPSYIREKDNRFASVPQISTSYKQSRFSWTTTQDTLNRLMVLVLRCNARDFDTDSELQQPLSDLQRWVYDFHEYFPRPTADLVSAHSRQRVRNAGAIPQRRPCDVSPAYYLSGWSANSFIASLVVFRRRYCLSTITLRCV